MVVFPSPPSITDKSWPLLVFVRQFVGEIQEFCVPLLYANRQLGEKGRKGAAWGHVNNNCIAAMPPHLRPPTPLARFVRLTWPTHALSLGSAIQILLA